MKKITILITFLLFLELRIEAQLPNLGWAYNFALYTKAGAFTNTGASEVVGSIGTHSGSFTGFPPGSITGHIYVADSVTYKAGVGLDSSNAFLSRIICDSVIGATMGSGQTYGPGKYCIGSAATVNGIIYLDGGGDTNSVFIFKVDGAFSMANHAEIVLINSAKLSNIFWQVNGAVELQDSSSFIGNIINNGTITLGSNASLQGRILSTSGAINMNNSLVDLGEQPDAALPVMWLYITATIVVHNHVLLQWATASEVNSEFFLIERMSEGSRFESISTLKASGHSHLVTTYAFNDVYAPVEVTYYRIKEVDIDGAFSYSPIVHLNLATSLNSLVVYPNPTNGLLSVNLSQTNPVGSCYFLIYNSIGVLVGHYLFTTRLNSLNLNHLSNGIYSYRMIYESGEVKNGQIVLLK